MSGRFAMVVAHPDDDTFGCGGTVALHGDEPEFHFTLVHVTSGEAGQISDSALATSETLGEVREEEDRRSWVTLGREPDRHEWFRYPDGGLDQVPLAELVDRIQTILAEERPDVVSTFEPDGVTGHVDHVAVSRATTEAFHRLRKDGSVGFRRLLHSAVPKSLIDQWNERLIADGKEPFDPDEMYQPKGVADHELGLIVDTSSVAERVIAALREHRTQAGDLADSSEEELIELASREYAIVAWPPRSPGEPVLTDVFQDL